MSKDISNSEFQSIAYFAIGVSSEGSIGGKEQAYVLSFAGRENGGTKLEPVANSGYSLGMIQNDLGQRNYIAKDLVKNYQIWADNYNPSQKFPIEKEAKIIHDLSRTGNTIRSENGRPLDSNVKPALNRFLASPEGVDFVHKYDDAQIAKLQKNVFNHLIKTELYKNSSFDDKVRLATVTSKLFNQSEKWGERLLQEIKNNKYQTFDEVYNRIDSFVKGKNDYIKTGCDHALKGAEVVIALNKANPNNPFAKDWENLSNKDLVSPSKINGEEKERFNDIKSLFLEPDKAIRKIHQANTPITDKKPASEPEKTPKKQPSAAPEKPVQEKPTQEKPTQEKPEKAADKVEKTEKAESSPQLSPQAQKLFQQYDEKFTALCEKRGITADCKEDFENLRGAAVATALANGLPNIEKVDIDSQTRMLWLGSYNPRPQVTSLSVDEAVNIPMSESMAKIHTIEQQNAQQAQERQMAQSQQQNHGLKIG